jgi:hypothetical protein
MRLVPGVQEPKEQEQEEEEEEEEEKSPWAWWQGSTQETEAPVKTKERSNVSKKKTSP